MVIVIFLPGGLMEGLRRIGRLFSRGSTKKKPEKAAINTGPTASQGG